MSDYIKEKYSDDIKKAKEFLLDHSYDRDLKFFISDMKMNSDEWTHSEKWAEIYDWLDEHLYPIDGEVVTGLVYIVEGN